LKCHVPEKQIEHISYHKLFFLSPDFNSNNEEKQKAELLKKIVHLLPTQPLGKRRKKFNIESSMFPI